MNGFYLYSEYSKKLEMLSNEQLGKLIRAVFDYINNGETTFDDSLVEFAFGFIKADIDKQQIKYNANRENGKKGGRPKKTEENPTETEENPTKPNETQQNLKKEKEKENKKENQYIKENAKAILDYLNLKTGKQFKYSISSLEYIEARLKDGFTVEECKRVIDIKCAKWLHDPKFNDYLRPQTLFRPSKFEAYLNEEIANKHMFAEITDDKATQSQISEVKTMLEKMKS